MAKSKNAPAIKCQTMPFPADDSRDPQFHLDITKKNEDAGRIAKNPKSKY